MKIASCCRTSFKSSDQKKGQSYFQDRRVELVERSKFQVHSEVKGSGYASYDVYLDWRDADSQSAVTATCSCPRFEDGYICKHLWATLLEIDLQEIVQALPEMGLYVDDVPFDEFLIDQELAPCSKTPKKMVGSSHSHNAIVTTAAPVQTSGSTFSTGKPTKLFDAPYFVGPARAYDVSADGQRFLMIKDSTAIKPTSTPDSIVVVLNWREDLKQRVPVK